MGIVIDSSIFIAAERGKLDLDSRLAAHGAEPLAMAAITASELLHGVHRAQNAQQQDARRTFVESLLQRIPILPFELATARVHANLWAQLASAGMPMAAHDLLIAATAIAHGYRIATHDLRSFPKIPGVDVVSW